MPWEDETEYPSNFATPLEVAIEASNGASDYGNKFGEPVIAGFARSFGMQIGKWFFDLRQIQELLELGNSLELSNRIRMK